MTSKTLTAKLSDGREYDIASEWHAKEDSYIFAVLAPIKKQPREWWAVVDKRYEMHSIFNSEQAAKMFWRERMVERSLPILVREVVE